MSDLDNLFALRQKPYTPIKRLFADDSSSNRKQNRTRSREPNKSIRKYSQSHTSDASISQPKAFAKRYLQKEDIKKEMNHYNQLILLTFIRKMFFIMGAVILLNIFLTSSSQSMILANMVLALMFVDINFGNDILGYTYFLVCKEILKVVAFCINFYQFYLEIHSGNFAHNELAAKILLISINAVLNYIIISVCEPLVRLESMHNNKNPYDGFLQSLRLQFLRLWRSLKGLYYLRKPIILLNLVYWLFVVVYISYKRSDELLNNLLTIQTLFTFCLTTLLLYFYIYFINKINETIRIDLLSSNKKAISLSILRLDCQNLNNETIVNEALKYLWKNCEIIWDVQLITHKYSINYDILEDYLNMQLVNITETAFKTYRSLQFQGKYKRSQFSFFFLSNLSLKFDELRQVYKFAQFIKTKEYLFYVLEQIIYFESYSDEFPIDIKHLRKKIMKIDELIKFIVGGIQIFELKQCLLAFDTYFNRKILGPLTQ